MRKGGGPRKGGAFERLIAKQIVKAFKDFGVKQEDCWRSVLSGGHFMSSGDLRMSKRMERLFPHSVECKHRKKIRWENFMLAKKSEEASWITQAVEGAKKSRGSSPLLIMKANNYPILAMYPVKSNTNYRPIVIDKEGRYWRLTNWTRFLKRAVKYANK
jgi:hypothetical protein